MVKVYLEQGNWCRLIAVFDEEEDYIRCLPALEEKAKEENGIITESVTGEILSSVVDKGESK